MLAYYEGYAHCKDGGELDGCPFPKRSSKRKLWIKGFNDCNERLNPLTLKEVDSMENGMKEELTSEEK